MLASTRIIAGAVTFMLIGCLSSVDGSGWASECSVDAECDRYTKPDGCSRGVCRSGRCNQDLIRDTAECQCHRDEDCGTRAAECSTANCEHYKCLVQIDLAGPATKQRAGDCRTVTCDGTNAAGTTLFEPGDVPADECRVALCDPATRTPTVTKAADGTPCSGGNGVCFAGACLPCKPAVCGGEAGEPANDSGQTASSLKQHQPLCGYTSATDVDWYTFFAKDEDLDHDVYSFDFWSSAPTLEVCIYVRCGNGTPEGGCSTKLTGPNDSKGCCWTGPPSTLKPRWDMNCPYTGEDSGTTYVSVRAPGGGSCETYAMSGGY